jgi:hypothetical protein
MVLKGGLIIIMKTMFRKAVSVLASAAMIGSTMGMAAAVAYPAPFNAGNSAVIYGADANPLDMTSAASIQNDIETALVSDSSGSATVEGGDSYMIEKTSTKFYLGSYVGDVTSSNLDEDELPTLLAKGKYIDSDNEEKDYTQKINVSSAIQLKMFNDNDYAKDDPTLGFRLTNEQHILNYTLDFTDKPNQSKMETTDLPLMGKEYYVLDAASDLGSITLLDSAATAILSEGDSITLNGKDVSIAFIGSTPEVKLTVDGESTNTLTEGQTFKLSDGSYVGIKDIMYSAKDTGISQVEFSIGSGKLKIENAQKVEMNDEDVKNVYGYIETSGTTLDNLVLKWTANDETFITADQEITMPGFESVKLAFGGIDFPVEETIEVSAGGNDYAVLNDFPLAGGSVDIPLVGKAAGNANYTFVGSDTDELLVTSAGSTVTFDGSSSSNDEMFVITWADTTDAETYLVRPTGFDNNSNSDPAVDFEYNDGSGWVKKYDDSEQDDELSFGSAEVTLTTLTAETGSESVVLTAGTGVSFNTVYSAEGLKVTLPWINTTALRVGVATNYTADAQACAAQEANFVGTGAVSFALDYYGDGDAGAVNTTCNVSDSYNLIFKEENKDGDKALGNSFNVTIGNSGASNYYASVTGVGNYTSTREKSDTDVYESWMYGALATKFVEDDSGDQDTVTITYHGGESKAKVYVNSVDATLSSSESGVAILDDSATVSGKNVVVVGGSAINSVAASLLGGDLRGPAFTEATGVGAGSFLIETFDNGDDTVSTLVAGYDVADTVKAAAYLVNLGRENVDIADGKKYTGSSAEEATLAVTA